MTFFSQNPKYVVWHIGGAVEGQALVDGQEAPESGILESSHNVKLTAKSNPNDLTTLWLDTNDDIKTAHNSYVDKKSMGANLWDYLIKIGLIEDVNNPSFGFMKVVGGHRTNERAKALAGKPLTGALLADGKRRIAQRILSQYNHVYRKYGLSGYAIQSYYLKIHGNQKSIKSLPPDKQYEWLKNYISSKPAPVETKISYKNNTLSLSGFSEDEAITNFSYNYNQSSGRLTINFVANFSGELSVTEINGGSGQFFSFTGTGQSISFPVNADKHYELKFRKGRSTIRQISISTLTSIPIEDEAPEPDNDGGTYYPVINPTAPRNTNIIGAYSTAKYRIITPDRGGNALYQAVRSLSAAAVQSYVARGYKVNSVPQDTPLMPMTLYKAGYSTDYAPNSARRGSFANRIKITDLTPNRRYTIAPITAIAGRRTGRRTIV